MFCLFVLALAVQHNDPDPALWMLLYAVPAVFSFLSLLGRTYRFAIVPAAIYLVLCVAWSPDWRNVDSTVFRPRMQMMGDDIERAREVVGLFIAAVWMATLGIIALRNHRRRRTIAPVSDETSSS